MSAHLVDILDFTAIRVALLGFCPTLGPSGFASAARFEANSSNPFNRSCKLGYRWATCSQFRLKASRICNELKATLEAVRE